MLCFRHVLAALVASLSTLASVDEASAADYKVLHSFCQESLCKDGYAPNGGLVRDAQGNLYGTTVGGGAIGEGEIFELSPNGSGWDFNILYSFCSKKDCTDGGSPSTKLIMDSKGNLYGADNGLIGGSVFELMPNTGHTKWNLKTLYVFCKNGGNCTDGLSPLSLSYQGSSSGLPYDGVSPLYGTAQLGGAHLSGTVFMLNPPPRGKKAWKEKILYDFCAQANCADGFTPSSGITIDASGNLYGTTSNGGAVGTSGTPEGVLYELSPNGNRWSESTLYNFCQQKNCQDGMSPNGTVVIDNSGFLWGEAGGGKMTKNQYGGLVYSWKLLENVMHTFCATKNCTDGQTPSGGLMIDANNNIFGVTIGGQGAKTNGTIFKFAGANTFNTLHAFCGNNDHCTGGEFPSGDLIADGSGNLFGTTGSGGANSHGNPGGTIFELTSD
jgi:uncharacterized repeat protein (TIGR03803 family)